MKNGYYTIHVFIIYIIYAQKERSQVISLKLHAQILLAVLRSLLEGKDLKINQKNLSK